jgi:hypothetical protein
MNDVGIFLYGGLWAQGLLALAALILWFFRRRGWTPVIQAGLLVVGGFVCLLTLLFPAAEILLRIGLSNASDCLADPDCRSNWLFNAKWIAASLAAIGIQFVLFMLTRRTPPST